MTTPHPTSRDARRRRRAGRVPWPAIALVVAMTTTGCSTAASVDDGPVFALDRDVVAEVEPVEPDGGPVVAAPELRLLLQQLLTDHATLSTEVMRRVIDGGDAATSLDLLTDNTDDLTSALGLVYGPVGAQAFDQLWTSHIEFFDDYAAAIRRGDTEAADAAVAHLGHYEHDFADFVATATTEGLDVETVLAVLHEHVGQLTEQADAWRAGDHPAAVAASVEAFDHTAVIAAALATAIATQQPDRFPGDAVGGAADACAERHLVVRRYVTAAADVATAARIGPDAYRAAAADELARQRAGIEAADLDEIVAVVEIEDGSDVGRRRSELLAATSAAVVCD